VKPPFVMGQRTYPPGVRITVPAFSNSPLPRDSKYHLLSDLTGRKRIKNSPGKHHNEAALGGDASTFGLSVAQLNILVGVIIGASAVLVRQPADYGGAAARRAGRSSRSWRTAVKRLENRSENTADIDWLIQYVCAAGVRHPDFGDAVNRWRAEGGDPPLAGDDIQIARELSLSTSTSPPASRHDCRTAGEDVPIGVR
jgi:hypothetical protein